MRKTLLAAIVVAAFAVFPIIDTGSQLTAAHASIHPRVLGSTTCPNGSAPPGGTTTVGVDHLSSPPDQAVTYPLQCDGCTGPLVAVYGSSALKKFIQTTATAFCNAQPTKAGAPDVEYASGGDSCPGDYYVFNPANAGLSNMIGASDVYAGGCPGSLSVPDTTKIQDSVISVNAVVAIAYCPGANEPQQGGVHPPAAPVLCNGSGTGAAGSATFSAPGDMSDAQAKLFWNQGVTCQGQVGGTGSADPASAQCVAPQVQHRASGSGTRATWCYNVFTPGDDADCNGTTASNAASTGTMMNDVCGNPFASPPTAPADGPDGVGYVTRSAIDVDPRQTSATQFPMAGCGDVSLGGHSGVNGTCDPTNAATQTAANSRSNPATGGTTRICNGDYDVATGVYSVWGYEHLALSTAQVSGGRTAAAQQYLTFLAASANQGFNQQVGFMLQCQMYFTRSIDGGGYSVHKPTC